MKRITLFLFILTFTAMAQDGVKPIIDVHVHGYTERTYRPVQGAPENFELFKKEMKRVFEKYNIVYAVKSGGAFDADMESRMLQGYESNNYPEFDTIQFKSLIEQDKVQVWGEFMPMFNGMTVADPGFAPFLKICEREGIPIALHTGRGPPSIYKRYPEFRLHLGDPLLIDEVLIKYPKLKIYLMHAGIPFFENTLALMDQYPQVYVDLGAVLFLQGGSTPFHVAEFLKKVKDYGFVDRVMFGSDSMYWPDELENSIRRLDSFEFLDEQDKRKIFYENAVRFFELDFLND
ncbi:amidohydrolase family protein [Robiginitalea sp. SC105]|uniref:amidohydrolase family protein n=1 Tax=Robiginitalea sp. SC105 TaxID=2762332 RepID=UPI00163B0B58|nr:amidohydrolase family protein [Robiginitalea sp. SC105]MBC2838160.1 amidohydrolase family protein [Robiginitalea sp. SC105]